MLENAVEQRSLNGCRIGVRIGTSCEADRAQSAAAGWSDRAGRGVKIAVVAGLDTITEKVEHARFVDCGCGKDASTRGAAGDLSHREPVARGERRSRVEPETAPSDRLPDFA